MDSTCCYARADKIWAHDPDGNEWEIYVITNDSIEAESESAAMIEPSHRRGSDLKVL